jgi:hypothetical protein
VTSQIPRRLRTRRSVSQDTNGRAVRVLLVDRRSYIGDTINHTHRIGDEVFVTTNVDQSDHRVRFADDFMPAMLASAPILAIILLLSLTNQGLLLRSILYEGNPLALLASLLPLFFPTLAVAGVRLAKARGWLRWSVRASNRLAIVLATSLTFLVPLNYVALQLATLVIAAASRAILRSGLKRHWSAVSIAAITLAAIAAIGAVAGWNPREVDRLPRSVVGRVVDGFTRMNIDDREGGRSVLVISVNDAYAIVATRDYPPRIESIPAETLKSGQLCQLEPRWNQRSLASYAGEFLMGKSSSTVTMCKA